MKILLIFTGKTTDSYLKEGIDIFFRRLSNYAFVTLDIVSVSSSKEKIKALDEEAKAINSKLKPGDFLVVLDERGSELSSRQLASLFEKWMVHGIGRVVFITGGPFGVSPVLKTKADYILSVSKLTFTHQMVRLILTEQIYRAMTIIKNEGYHHD